MGFSSSTTAEFFISARALTLSGGGKVEHMHTTILYIHFKTYDRLLKQKMKKMKETKINKITMRKLSNTLTKKGIIHRNK